MDNIENTNNSQQPVKSEKNSKAVVAVIVSMIIIAVAVSVIAIAASISVISNLY
jgi:hypothetical protein